MGVSEGPSPGNPAVETACPPTPISNRLAFSDHPNRVRIVLVTALPKVAFPSQFHSA